MTVCLIYPEKSLLILMRSPSLHYDKTPMKYTANFYGCKNDNFLIKNNNVYPCTPQFYYIKGGVRGSPAVCMITRTCYPDVRRF